MNEQVEQSAQPAATGGLFRVLWRNKAWWMLPLAVLVGLLAIVYVLGHLTSADSEMYPTSSTGNSTYSRLS